jgi:hypothetical protein
LIFDELERGIHNIVDPARRSQNISFLQMVSEEAARDDRVTLFAAVYDGNVERGSTLKRTPRIELRFRNAEDRASIVRHRLFENAKSYDQDAARALIRSYVNTWRGFGVEVADPYLSHEPQQVQFEEESLGHASSKEEVLSYLRTQVFPVSPSGLSDPGLKGADRILEGKRFRVFERGETTRQAEDALLGIEEDIGVDYA